MKTVLRSVCFLCLFFLACLTGCGDKCTEHTFDEGTLTKAPTCIAVGQKTYACTACGETKIEIIEPTGEHTMNLYTFDETGHRPVCSGCGLEGKRVAHTGEETLTTPRDCIHGEVFTYACSVCNYTKTRDGQPSTQEHNYVASTDGVSLCYGEEETEFVCTGCQASIRKTLVLGHDMQLGSYKDGAWKAGTFSGGTLVYTCRRVGCGLSYTVSGASVGITDYSSNGGYLTKNVKVNGKTYSSSTAAVVNTADASYFCRLPRVTAATVAADFDISAPEQGLATGIQLLFKTSTDSWLAAPLQVTPEGAVKNVKGVVIAEAGTVASGKDTHVTIAFDFSTGTISYTVNGTPVSSETVSAYKDVSLQYMQFTLGKATTEEAVGTGFLLRNVAVGTAFALTAGSAEPKVPTPSTMKLNPIFASHAVFQRGQVITLAGTGEGSVTATFKGQTYTGSSKDGKFSVQIPAQEAGGPYTITVNLDGKETVLSDIMFGDVILLAGQSNAELTLDQTDCDSKDYATNENVRIYYAEQYFTDEFHYTSPLDNRWTAMQAKNDAKWPAIAYHLGQMLEKDRGVAVGVVCVVKGAAVIQSFMSEEANAAFQIPANQLSSSHTSTDRYRCFNAQGMIYHRMFETILPYVVSSAVWYQGESNNSTAEGAVYDQMLAAMIDEWREDLNQPTLPFAIVKIPPYSTDAGWTAVRQAQVRAAQSIANCTLVDIDDLNQNTIHPRNKFEVSQRIFQVFYAAE